MQGWLLGGWLLGLAPLWGEPVSLAVPAPASAPARQEAFLKPLAAPAAEKLAQALLRNTETLAGVNWPSERQPAAAAALVTPEGWYGVVAVPVKPRSAAAAPPSGKQQDTGATSAPQPRPTTDPPPVKPTPTPTGDQGRPLRVPGAIAAARLEAAQQLAEGIAQANRPAWVPLPSRAVDNESGQPPRGEPLALVWFYNLLPEALPEKARYVAVLYTDPRGLHHEVRAAVLATRTGPDGVAVLEVWSTDSRPLLSVDLRPPRRLPASVGRGAADAKPASGEAGWGMEFRGHSLELTWPNGRWAVLPLQPVAF